MIYPIIKLICDVLKKINITYVCIAFVHWGLSFFTDRFIFNLQTIFGNSDIFVRYKIFKIILLGILFVLWQAIYYIIKEYKNNENIRKWLKYSFIYFAIMMFFLLLTWPGIWRCDELSIFQSARVLHIDYWQGFSISKFYILSLMLLPFPTGIIIIQNIIIASIVGYAVLKVQNYFKPIRVDFLIFIPFLLLSVIDNNLYPMRTTLYGYMWILLIIKIMFINAGDKVKFMDIFVITLVALIIYFLRTEGVLCLFFIPVIFYYFFYKLSNKQQKIMFIILCSACLFVIFHVQNTMQYKNNKKYEIYSIIVPMAKLYLQLDENAQKKASYVIDKITDMPEFVKGSQINIQQENIIKKFTKNEYNNFLKLYLKLVFNYPYLYFQERFIEFINSSDNIWETTKLFNKNSIYEQFEIVSLKSFQPMNINLRKRVISFIERRDVNNYNLKLFGFGIFYAPLQLIFIMLFVSLSFFIFKEYKNLIISSLLFIATGFVIAFVPVTNFMYYFYLYLASYMLLTISIIKISIKFKGFFHAFKK